MKARSREWVHSVTASISFTEVQTFVPFCLLSCPLNPLIKGVCTQSKKKLHMDQNYLFLLRGREKLFDGVTSFSNIIILLQPGSASWPFHNGHFSTYMYMLYTPFHRSSNLWVHLQTVLIFNPCNEKHLLWQGSAIAWKVCLICQYRRTFYHPI